MAQIRGLKHDLTARTDFAQAQGLNVKAATLNQLQRVNSQRTYVASRYEMKPRHPIVCPDRFDEVLSDVAAKVKVMLAEPAAPPPCPHCGHNTVTTRALEAA